MTGASKLAGTDFSDEVTDLLLLNGTRQFNDLLSRNIQRGRDHGIPGKRNPSVQRSSLKEYTESRDHRLPGKHETEKWTNCFANKSYFTRNSAQLHAIPRYCAQRNCDWKP